MGRQTAFADIQDASRKRAAKREEFLRQMDAAIPWEALVALARPHCFGGGAAGGRLIACEQPGPRGLQCGNVAVVVVQKCSRGSGRAAPGKRRLVVRLLGFKLRFQLRDARVALGDLRRKIGFRRFCGSRLVSAGGCAIGFLGRRSLPAPAARRRLQPPVPVRLCRCGLFSLRSRPALRGIVLPVHVSPLTAASP